MYWDILCDFDGTITHFDVTDSLLEQFAKPAWLDVEKEWESGKIGSKECLSRQIQLLNMSRFELDRRLDQIAIDPDFATFVRKAQEKGHKVTVLSDGLDYSIHRILRRYGLGHLPVLSNDLHQSGDRNWRITFPNADSACRFASGHCKCASRRRIQSLLPNERGSLLIGDGRSDFCLAETADLVFAKDKLIDRCRRQNLPHCAINGFADAIGLLEKIGENSAALLNKEKNWSSRRPLGGLSQRDVER